jgi:hypothetical protein
MMTTPNNPETGEDSGLKEQAKQAVGTAAEQGQNVAGVAKDEAQSVAQEARDQARGLLGEARSQLEEQSRTQRDRLVGTLRTLGDDLERMANGDSAGQGMAQDVARQVADRARDLSSRMDGREPADLLEDVRAFARRKPGMFLLGALAAGVVAGRVTRGAKEAAGGTRGASTPRSDDGSGIGVYGAEGQSPYDDPRAGTATGNPIAGTGSPTDPVYPAGSRTGTPGGVSPGPAAGEALDPDIGATPGTPPLSDSPWTDDPTRRGSV